MKLNFDDHRRLAYRAASRFVRNYPAVEADDARQEYLLKLWQVCESGTYDVERAAPSTFITSSLRGAQYRCRRESELVHGAPVASLDEETQPGGEHTRLDELADDTHETEAEVEAAIQRARLRAAVSRLPPQVRRCLALRFGLDGRPLTIAATAKALAVPRSRVVALERAGLETLRARRREL